MCSIHACSFWACVGNFALVAVFVWMMRSIANGALLRSIAQNVPTNCGYFRAFGEPGTLWAIFFLLCIVFLGKEIRFLAAGSAPPLPHVVQAMSAAMSVRPLYVCTIFICRKNLITLIMNFRYYNKQAYKWARLASSLCLCSSVLHIHGDAQLQGEGNSVTPNASACALLSELIKQNKQLMLAAYSILLHGLATRRLTVRLRYVRLG